MIPSTEFLETQSLNAGLRLDARDTPLKIQGSVSCKSETDLDKSWFPVLQNDVQKVLGHEPLRHGVLSERCEADLQRVQRFIVLQGKKTNHGGTNRKKRQAENVLIGFIEETVNENIWFENTTNHAQEEMGRQRRQTPGSPLWKSTSGAE